MSYLRLFFCLFVFSAVVKAQNVPLEMVPSRIEILDVAKAKNGWTDVRDPVALDGNWTGALKSFPLSNETLEFRLLLAPTGARPTWWGQVITHPGFPDIRPQKSVLHPSFQLEAKGKTISLPVQAAEARGPVWEEELGLYSVTIFAGPQPTKEMKGGWPRDCTRIHFTGALPDLFGAPESPFELPFDLDFSLEPQGKTKQWTAHFVGRKPHIFLKNVRVDKNRDPKSRHHYEVKTTYVGVWPSGIPNHISWLPEILDGNGRSISPFTSIGPVYEGEFDRGERIPNQPYFVTRTLALEIAPERFAAQPTIFYRVGFPWSDSVNVTYPIVSCPIKREATMLLGDVPPSEWKFEQPSLKPQ